MKTIHPVIATTIFISILASSWLFLPSVWNYSTTTSFLAGMEAAKDTVHLFSNELEAVVVNNEAYGKIHGKKYNGVSELRIKGDSSSSPFVPAFSGLNFEHIFNGDSASLGWDIFEPRRAPIELVRLSDAKVELRQLRTKNWPLESSITYELKNNSIEMVYTGVPDKKMLWEKHGYIGLFFASYMAAPIEKGIHFIGRPRSDTGSAQPRWIYHLPKSHGDQANHRPVGSKWDPSYDPGFEKKISLASGFSNWEYSYPFYYGISGNNVLIMMFEERKKDSEVRFAQSPDGAGELNPAWDFIFYQKKLKVGKPFSFRACAVYKKFEGKEDVIRIYEKWSGKKVDSL